MKIEILKNHENAKIPNRATSGSSGYDLYATEDAVVCCGSRVLIKTGIKVKIPQGYEIQIRPRSGLALKHGITVLNTPGTIDSDYRNEIGVILMNSSPFNYEVKAGDKIAQAVLCKVETIDFKEVNEEEYARENIINERKEKGFGSSGSR